MNEEDDEDPVVQEIPVYLSQMLADKLFLYQFPMQHREKGYDDTRVLASSIKPQHQEVRLEVGLDVRNPNFDTGKGEQIALNVDGLAGKDDKKPEEKIFKSNMMDKVVLTSTRSLSSCSNYALGVLHDKEFHVTPLRGIVALRPSFGYLDKSDKRAKEDAKERGEADLSGEDEEEEEEMKQITVKFARRENDKLKQARERSYGYLSKKIAEEQWYHTSYHHSKTDRAELERGKLYCSATQEPVTELSLTPSEYLATLLSSDGEDKSVPNAEAVCRKDIRHLSLLEQVKTVLKEAKIVRFSTLLSLLPPPPDPKTVLRAVQQVGVLVKGNWVVRSDVLYPKDSASNMFGVPAEFMCRARDYILHLLNQQKYVDRKQATSEVRLPPDEVKIIISQVARLEKGKGWELLLPLDEEFISRYPDVVDRQRLWWEAKRGQMEELLCECPKPQSRSRRKSTRDSSVGSSDGEAAGRRRKSLHRDSVSSDEGGAEHWNNHSRAQRRPVKDKVAVKAEPMET